MPELINAWDSCIGREQSHEDRVDARLVARWCATFDRTAPADGHAPQGLHWCLGLPDAATAALGPDGHPLRDDSAASFLPPVALPRRMWASSAMEFHAPLPAGAAVRRVSRIAAITARKGAGGPLVFVDIEHRTSAGDALLVSETQTVVYRDAAPAGAAPVPPPPGPARFDPSGWALTRAIVPSSVLLFRYSALTFNSHRIHYDLAYARDAEGYRGLLVHGPLTASLLLDLARRHLGDNRLASFRFRALSPAIAGETLNLALRQTSDGLALAACAEDQRVIMEASAVIGQ